MILKIATVCMKNEALSYFWDYEVCQGDADCRRGNKNSMKLSTNFESRDQVRREYLRHHTHVTGLRCLRNTFLNLS